MKILVISDSHGNIANLKHVMGFAKNINAKTIIHCGDWNTLESVETVTAFGIKLYAVIGNADIADDVKNKFKEFLELEIDGRKIGITHKPSNIKKFFEDKKLDIIFCGHLHSQNQSDFDGIRVVRPGSLEGGINFAIYDTVTGKIEFFDV